MLSFPDIKINLKYWSEKKRETEKKSLRVEIVIQLKVA